MKNKQIKTVMKGALILSLASFIAKILSAFYRIPFENLVGNTGFYVYQQVYPLYGIAMTFALSGFPVYISKLIAQTAKEQQIALAKRLWIILAIIAISIFVFLNLGANFLAKKMGDEHLSVLITSVSWMILLMPFLAVGRGYYQGTFDMVPTAISQISEQLIRVFIIILAAILAVKYSWSYYQMGALAMFGSTAGAIVATLSFRKFYLNQFTKKTATTNLPSYQKLTKGLLSEGLIICLFASMMVLLQLVDSFTVKNSLEASGIGANFAKELKGTYDRAQPLVQLGMVVAISFSSTLLPALSRAIQAKNVLEFKRTAGLIVKLSTTLACAACAGLIALMPQINTLLFGDDSLSATISVYVLSVLLMGLISTYTSILQSVEQFKSTLVGLMMAVLIKMLLNGWLIEKFGIMGASLATIFGLLATLLIVLSSLPGNLRGFLTPKFCVRLGASVLAMLTGVLAIRQLCLSVLSEERLDALIISLITISFGAGLFLVATFKFKVFTLREWVAIPGGKKFLRLFNKMR